jgi:hypothetical protein
MYSIIVKVDFSISVTTTESRYKILEHLSAFLLFYALICKPLKTLGQIEPRAVGERVNHNPVGSSNLKIK